MARIRMIKPEFFDDPAVADLTPLARLLFIGLWLQADREGRLEDDRKRLRARIFPYDDVNLDSLLTELEKQDMIRRYKAVKKNGEPWKKTAFGFIWIRNFAKHQRPHPKEPASVIPPWSTGAVKKHGEPWKKTEGTSDPLESNGVQEPPIVPLSGGLSKRDLKAARDKLGKVFLGHCPHNPTCDTSEECIQRLAKRSAAV